jgi:hypothetical protein
MSWQDVVLTAGSVPLLLALLPTVTGPDKPAVVTALCQGAVLLVFAATYTTLGLYFTALVTLLSGVLWLVIMAQALGARRA